MLGNLFNIFKRAQPQNNNDDLDSKTQNLYKYKTYHSDYTHRFALQAYNHSPAIRAVVGKIAERFSAIEWKIVIDKEDFTEHPILDIWKNNSKDITHAQMKKLLIIYLELTGEAFLWKVRSELDGKIKGLFIIPTDWCNNTPNPENDFFNFNPRYGSSFSVLSEDIVWFKDPNIIDPYSRGQGIGQALADEIAIDELAANHVATTFKNRGRPDLLVSAGKDNKVQFSPIQAEMIKEALERDHKGTHNAGKTMVTTANIDIKEIGQSLDDLKLNDLRTWERDYIAATWGIPPEMLGILLNSNRSTMDLADHFINTNILVPRLNHVCDVLNQHIINETDDRALFMYVNPIQEDKEFKKSVMTTRPHDFTRNEWRQLAGFDKVPDGDVYLMPLNLISVPQVKEDPIKLAPKRIKTINKDDVDIILSELEEEALQNIISNFIVEAATDFGQSGLDLFEFEQTFNLSDEFVVDVLLNPETAERITNINETTKDQIRDILSQAVDEGQSQQEIINNISNTFETIKTSRAKSIAQTEIGRAQNIGLEEGFNQGGADGKEWSALLDDRTREDHINLDGTVVGLGENFTSGSGVQSQGPSQSGVASFDINCRCIVLPVIQNTTLSNRTNHTKMFDNQRQEIETELTNGLTNIFENQAEQVIERFKEVF